MTAQGRMLSPLRAVRKEEIVIAPSGATNQGGGTCRNGTTEQEDGTSRVAVSGATSSKGGAWRVVPFEATSSSEGGSRCVVSAVTTGREGGMSIVAHSGTIDREGGARRVAQVVHLGWKKGSYPK